MTVILDGVELASQIKADITERVAALNNQGIKVGLGTILVGSDPGSMKYVAGKHKDCADVGIESIRVDLPETATEAEILRAVEDLNANPDCTGYIVQLPLPKNVDQTRIIEAIDPKKDADGLHPFNLGSLVLNVNEQISTPLPCTPYGIIKLIQHYLGDDYLKGKNVCVLGRGVTVGRSIGLLLTRREINATVTLCHTGTQNIAEHTKEADVVIAAVGQPYFVKPDMLKDGAVVLDVGVSRDADGKIKGDVDPACYDKVQAYSPNPRGVGPMTRAMLLENVVVAAI